tara:strand:- start:189 stop:470 length:282 start_codon:yes stop_codon:yes gene_type:complete
LFSGSEEALMLRVHPHKSSTIEGGVVIVQLKQFNAVTTRVLLPPDSLKDCLATVVVKPFVDHLSSELHEQIPDLGVLAVEGSTLLSHFITPAH